MFSGNASLGLTATAGLQLLLLFVLMALLVFAPLVLGSVTFARMVERKIISEQKAREDAARSGNGSGLGLSIVKSIVDMHGYQISLLQPYGTYTKAFIVTCALEF